ncbi:hypothetical protein T12_171 [Trichinella patagoniensis]|uniref:Uncharacterized protein n=1 Tax=Trichinella patagoniensis TaxID=990121 RepID=A0A0V1AEN8_9BILA|nr:hypothetical protein T12_171 [Trichinella patagoniensis]
MQKFLEFWERSAKTERLGVHSPVQCREFAKLDAQKRCLSYCCLKACLVACFVKKPCPKPGCGKQQHAMLYAAASEPGTEEPAPEKRYFPDRPCPIIRISENSMAVSSLLVTGSWQTLISRDFCDALGLKGPPVVTAAQRKSVSM